MLWSVWSITGNGLVKHGTLKATGFCDAIIKALNIVPDYPVFVIRLN